MFEVNDERLLQKLCKSDYQRIESMRITGLCKLYGVGKWQCGHSCLLFVVWCNHENSVAQGCFLVSLKLKQSLFCYVTCIINHSFCQGPWEKNVCLSTLQKLHLVQHQRRFMYHAAGVKHNADSLECRLEFNPIYFTPHYLRRLDWISSQFSIAQWIASLQVRVLKVVFHLLIEKRGNVRGRR